MTTYTDALFEALETIAFDDTRDFEEVEAEFFATAEEGGMTEEDAISLWNEIALG